MKKIIYFLMLVFITILVYSTVLTLTSFVGQTNPFNITFDRNRNFTFFLDIPLYADVQNITLSLEGIAVNGTYDDFDDGILNGTLWNYTNYSATPTQTFARVFEENSNINLKAKDTNALIARARIIMKQEFFDTRVYFNFNSTVNTSGGAPSRLMTFGVVNSTDCALVVAGNCADNILHELFEYNANGYFNESWYFYINSTDFNITLRNLSDDTILGTANLSSYIGRFFTIQVFASTGAGGAPKWAYVNFTMDFMNFNDSSPFPYIEVGDPDGTHEWNFSKKFDTTINVSLNISLINNILDDDCNCTNCSLSNSICTMPLLFHSDTRGILQVNLSNATYEFGIDDCSNFKNKILNVSYFDERTETPIGVDNGHVLTFTGLFAQDVNVSSNNDTHTSFCSQNNRSADWNVTGTITLVKTDYATKVIELDAISPFIASTDLPTNISLFLIRLNESTTVKYTWFDLGYAPLNGIMRIFRCNLNGTRELFESAAIVEGIASANIELLATPYSYEIIVGGEIFTNDEGFSKCHTESETTLTFVVDTTGADVTPQIGLGGITCLLNKTGVNTVKMEWGNNPNDDSELIGCLFAYRQTLGSSVLIHTNCTTNNSIERTIPVNNSFNYIVLGKLFQSGFSIQCGSSVEFSTQADSGQTFGITSLFALALFILAMAMFYAGRSTESLIAAAIALVLAWVMGITSFNIDLTGWLTIGAMVAFLVIIALIGRFASK